LDDPFIDVLHELCRAKTETAGGGQTASGAGGKTAGRSSNAAGASVQQGKTVGFDFSSSREAAAELGRTRDYLEKDFDEILSAPKLLLATKDALVVEKVITQYAAKGGKQVYACPTRLCV
jgi:hypothetical protein